MFLGLAARINGTDLWTASRDLRLASLGLFVVFPLLLWGCMLFGIYDYLANARYYLPLLPLSVLVVYWVASLRVSNGNRLTKVVQVLSTIYVSGYVILTSLYVILFFAPGDRGMIERGRLLPGGPDPWPSVGVRGESSAARRFVIKRLKEQPGAVLLTTNKRALFVWDPSLDRSRIHELTCGSLPNTAQLNGPARVVILTLDYGEPVDLWERSNKMIDTLEITDNAPEIQHVECFERLPGLTLLRRFPQESLKVIESNVPAETSIVLRP
jgi:hypothetical protein